jgi:hypothetical protein
VTKLDLKKDLKHLYNPPSKQVVEVVVPPMQFIQIDGAGDPNDSPTFQAATETLYGLSYSLKFTSKKTLGIDYGVMPLEGLWWLDEGIFDLDIDRSHWRWTLMIMQPDHITPELFAGAVRALREKKNPANLDAARFVRFDEGLAAQVMHIGPYSTEMPTVERVHQFIEAAGYRPRGKHHEIYLSDPNRAAPDKMKTVLRQPMQQKTEG